MPADVPTKSARILYRPIGIASSIVGGLIASQVFRQVWKRAAPGDEDKAPKPLSSDHSWREVLAAAAAQGAIFAVVKAAIDRGGARAFQRWTGEWPGE